jgi:putative glutamine amidotransferase
MKKPPSMVWLPMDHRLLGSHEHQTPFLVLGDKYARAVKLAAQAQPILFPLADVQQIPHLLSLVDGVMLTGSRSNVHSSHFGEDLADPSLPLDRERDALTLSLVTACIDQAIPLLGVCRGFQEINVALGGTLHQQVQDVPGLMDHREPADTSIDGQYAPSHEVNFVKGSVFSAWAGADSARVNSLHGQGIGKLAQGLRPLGHAPDGLVEAFGVDGAQAFAYAVQWHPEWNCMETPFYRAIFEAFGQACRARQETRENGFNQVLHNAAGSI